MQKKLLIIEDDKDVADMLFLQAKVRGIKAHIASSADEACTFLKKEHPDWIILDLMLSEGHGFLFVSEMKKSKHLDKSKIPIIVYSALDDHKTIESAFLLGVDGFVPKPASPNTLFAHLKGAKTGKA